MRVSIITVCYNSESTIQDTIKSVLHQDYKDIEYIIIDGQSTDQTLAIVNKYKNKIAHIISEKDNGMYDAINKGIHIATGKIIGILNSDDFYTDKQVISKIVDEIENKKVDSLYADLEYVHFKNISKTIRYWKSGTYRHGLFGNGWMPPHPTFFVKKDIYIQYGLYNTTFKSAADYELMLRLLHKHKVSTTYLKKTIVKMRVGGMSNASFKNRINANKEDRKAWEINGLKAKWYTLYLKPLSKLKQYFTK